ncbi:MaoC family dehydratase [Novosphingobium colocasiae]|uniref:MaoC family dehydratase n=1 Tax=Novosphingobium colocasiae TaxID=1256513 RepID=UPI0035AFC2BD
MSSAGDSKLTVGDTHRFGSHHVTRDEIISFATLYDPQPFHLSEEAAAASPFGRLAASGWHTCAMMMGMLVREGPPVVDVERGGIGLGADGLRWMKPVYADDVLSCETTVVSKEPFAKLPGMSKVAFQIRVFNQHGEQVMETRLLGLSPD